MDSSSLRSFSHYPEIVKLLIDKNALVNAKNSEGYTPFAIASETGKPEIAEYLFKHGADPLLKTNENVSPFRLSMVNEEKAIMKFLKKNFVKNEISPFFNNIRISTTDLSINNRDFLYGFKAGIQDLRYNIFLNIGFSTRLWANRTLVPITDTIADNYYQFWETRSILNISVEKLFRIAVNNDFKQGIFIEAKGNYTYGKYRASNKKPIDKIIFSPCIGYTIYNSGIGARISYEYLKLNVYKMPPHRINIGIFL